jgi:hypothetical protein
LGQDLSYHSLCSPFSAKDKPARVAAPAGSLSAIEFEVADMVAVDIVNAACFAAAFDFLCGLTEQSANLKRKIVAVKSRVVAVYFKTKGGSMHCVFSVLKAV